MLFTYLAVIVTAQIPNARQAFLTITKIVKGGTQ